jgi:hypothetical protein
VEAERQEAKATGDRRAAGKAATDDEAGAGRATRAGQRVAASQEAATERTYAARQLIGTIRSPIGDEDLGVMHEPVDECDDASGIWESKVRMR